MKQEIFQNILNKVTAGEEATLPLEISGSSFTRLFTPKERLILLGGGHIAQPLCELGTMLDFQVIVVDDRPSFANQLRFPKANQVICDGFESALEAIQIRKEDYVCVITRGHRHDGICLRKLLSGPMPSYLGMIGSKRRVQGLMEQLSFEGYDKEKLAFICAPIGLSIGGQTVTEIAVSIAAQLIEYRRKINKTHLPFNCLTHTDVNIPLLKTLSTGKDSQVLAIVLETKGSTPVKSGAMMSINNMGLITGTIGGGCGEAAVIQTASRMKVHDSPKIVQVDMTNDMAEEEGMVCGGTMRVLLEPIN